MVSTACTDNEDCQLVVLMCWCGRLVVGDTCLNFNATRIGALIRPFRPLALSWGHVTRRVKPRRKTWDSGPRDSQRKPSSQKRKQEE